MKKEKKLNKFTRIQYETDEVIHENKVLSSTLKISIISGVLLLVFSSLGYIIFLQRSKNKRLVLAREQQKANEEIYQLMIKQQSKLEEGRVEERERISSELHDGILGKLFGTRVGLGFLNIQGDEETTVKFKDFIKEIQQIEQEIRAVSHDLRNEILSSKTDFIKLIDDYIKGLYQDSIVEYSISTDKEIDWESVDNDTKIHLFRIVQEATKNIIQHANASEVKVALKKESNSLILKIEDDGSGIKKKKNYKGIGISNMISRVTKLEGHIDIDSNQNGTFITANIPLK